MRVPPSWHVPGVSTYSKRAADLRRGDRITHYEDRPRIELYSGVVEAVEPIHFEPFTHERVRQLPRWPGVRISYQGGGFHNTGPDTMVFIETPTC